MRHRRDQDRTPGSILRLIGALIATLGGVLTAQVTGAETVAERFDRAMQKKAEYCRTHKIDPANRRCDILKLKPADPLATEEGRFAHSIKIPNPVPADSGYKPGMTPEQYFDHLCKTEAGEFIYKTVEHVEGLYMMRPRKSEGNLGNHLYALEAPYGDGLSAMTQPGDYFVQPAIGKYQFLELPLAESSSASGKKQFLRLYRDASAHPDRDYQTAVDGRFVRVPYIVAQQPTETLRSRYGFTWRGITRPHDREHGIGGGEIIVLDLQTNEVLAVRRGFVLGESDPHLITSFTWATRNICPGREAESDYVFLREVLRPAPEQSTGGGQ